jgi:glycosyltransferase involved in cell wall biosynthesis
VRDLRNRVRRTAPSIVFANGGATLRYAALALAGMPRRPKLVYASIGEPAYWLRDGAHRRLQSALHRRSDLILAVSAATRNQLVELFGLSTDRVQVAHTGVPETFFHVPEVDRDDDLRLVFVGNLSKEKGPDVALDAVLGLRDRYPVRLRFVGTGPMQLQLEHRVARARAIGVIEFAGSVADVRPHLAWADVLVLTSETEGFPGVVLEAAAAATPTVAFDVGGTTETVVDGVTGVVVPAGDQAEFRTAIASLATNRWRVEEMGADAQRRVQRDFMLDQAVDRHDELLRNLLDVRMPPAVVQS